MLGPGVAMVAVGASAVEMMQSSASRLAGWLCQSRSIHLMSQKRAVSSPATLTSLSALTGSQASCSTESVWPLSSTVALASTLLSGVQIRMVRSVADVASFRPSMLHPRARTEHGAPPAPCPRAVLSPAPVAPDDFSAIVPAVKGEARCPPRSSRICVFELPPRDEADDVDDDEDAVGWKGGNGGTASPRLLYSEAAVGGGTSDMLLPWHFLRGARARRRSVLPLLYTTTVGMQRKSKGGGACSVSFALHLEQKG